MKHDPVAEAIISTIAKLKPHWKKYAAIAAIAAIAIVIAANMYSSEKNLPVKAGEALAMVTSPDALNEVVQKYPETFAASAALMQLGAYEAQRTNYAAAIMYFQRLVNEHQDSFLVPAANYAIVKCYVGERNYKEAENVLKRNLLYDRDHYAALAAQMELVNVLNAMGRYTDALNEIMQLEQTLGQGYSTSVFGGLKERLMRLTGATTNIQQQAYENTNLQK